MLILFMLANLINGNYNFKKTRIQPKNILLFTLLYLIYGFSMFYTDNKALGWFSLEIKLSLFLLPIVVWFSNFNYKNHLTLGLKWFLYGAILSGFLNFIDAGIQYSSTADYTEFFYGKFSVFHHPSYIAMYFNLAIIIIYYHSFKPKKNLIIKARKAIIGVAFFSLQIGLLSSKSGLITMMLTHIVAITYWTIKHKYYFRSFATVLVLSLSLGLVYSYSTSFQNRVNELTSVLSAKETSKTSSTGVRIYAWHTSIALLREHPLLGCGIGDASNALTASYKKQNLTKMVDKKINAHNQFLETGVAIGVLGLSILLLQLLLPLIFSIRENAYLYAFFIILFILNLVTESMLETQSGIVFYVVFNTLFFAAFFQKKQIG